MYNKSNYDHIFYRMKKTIPKSYILFVLVTVLKVYPLFFLSHSAGYMNPKKEFYSIHSYYKYFTLTYYLGTMNSTTLFGISIVILIINLLIICLFIIYLIISKKVQQIDQNYGDISSLGIVFFVFSNLAFFKYIILFQFFNEINFFPIVCFGKIDEETITVNNIFHESYKETISGLCNGSKKILYYSINLINILIDIIFNWILTSRFFDLNILSDYVWNFEAKYILSFEFLESFSQIFFIIFLFFDNKTFLISFSIYVGIIFLLNLFEKIQLNFFSTPKNYSLVIIRDFIAHLSYISTTFILLFMLINNTYPNDLSIVILLIMEIVISLIIYKIQHNNDSDLVKQLLVEPLANLTEKNIYPVLTFTLKEFIKFNDLNRKFDDENLDIFLYNYVDHLKVCDDLNCPCKGYLKKANGHGALTTVKSSGGNTSNLNFRIKKDGENEYILNTFFNVLSSNLNTSMIKITKGTNVNLEGKESTRQKLIFQLRVKLILAVKKLLSNKLEKLVKHIESNLSNKFSNNTKDFIRINFYSFSILCNNAYYKTQFYFYEYVNEIFRKKRLMEEMQHKNAKLKKSNIFSYEFYYIYYLYLRMFAIQKYNAFMTINKMNKKEGQSNGQNNMKLDFTKILSLCVKYYEIEDRLMKIVINFEEFIQYFIQEKIIFNNLIDIIKIFMKNFKGMINYIVHYFKNDKINNLFICSKIILLFKVINFQIPDEIYNKLTSQIHDLKDARSGNELDSNYYMILNYINGEFIIKYLSHELLIVLEYNEKDLKNKDFHILMPSKIQKSHKQGMITEIKGKNKSWNNKRIFFNTNSSHCILFDLQYKFLLNLRGEITILAVLFPVNNLKDTRNCFVCIDDSGEILALNKEFEDYFFLNMHMINIVKIDVEKLILQGMAPRMRTFFKDVSNVEFQEQFDYELYLQHLFGEEFDVLKENNDKDFQKKYIRCELLKESNKKGKYYTPYIEVNIKQRILGKQYLYFVNFSARVDLNKAFGYISGYSNNQLLIDTINNSMKEMAKMTILKNDIMNNYNKSKNRKKEKNEKNGILNEEEEDLMEDENIGTESGLEILSSDSGPNKKELLNVNSKNGFNIFSKNHFIVLLIVSIAILILISLFLTIFGLIFKINLTQGLMDIFYLEINSILLQNNIFFICETIINLGLIKDKIIDNYKVNGKTNLAKESIDLLFNQINLYDHASYNINFYTSKYYNKEISDYLEYRTDGIEQIFKNGFIYINKNILLFDEISKFKKKALDSYNYFHEIKELLIEGNINQEINDNITYNYFLLDYISNESVQIQINNSLLSLELNDQEITLFYILKNSIPDFVIYNENLINEFYNILKAKQNSTLKKIGVYKLAELTILIITIIIEWIFIYFGFRKFKNKIFNLRLKIEKNHIDIILQKIEEYKKFSNGLNIQSLYYISDMKYKYLPITQNYEEDIFISSMIATPTPTGDNEFNQGKNINSKISSSNNINNQEPINTEKGVEGKKNIWKMMQKLDKIKTGEIQSSGFDSGAIEEMNENNKIEKKPSKFVKEKDKEGNQKKEDNNINNNKINNIDDQTQPIIGVLRNNNEIKDEEDKEDDSKMNIIKKDEGLGLGLKKKNRTTKVQFKEKDIRYYSPGQGVNEVSHHPGFTEEMNESFNTKTNYNNDDIISNKNKLKNYISNSMLDKNKGISEYNKYTQGEFDTIRALNKKESEDNEIGRKNLKMNIGASYKNETMTKEEIEKKILNMIHSNLLAQVILNIAIIIFSIVFIISFVYNFILNSKLEKARNFTYYYFQKTSVMNEIILNYQLHLIKNIHDENIQDENKKMKLSDLVDNYKTNSEKIISFTNENNVNSILKDTSNLIGITTGKSFCENFSKFYLIYFSENNMNQTDLEEECLTLGEKININGYTDAESYSFTTLSVFIEDWKNIYNFNHIMDKESIKVKLNEKKFINIIEEVVLMSSKFSDVLRICLFNDFNRIFKNIKLLEAIFGVVSIVLEITFFIISLLLIIYPIRSIDIIINWFSKRYNK